MKKYLLILLLITFITPSVALAAWWNPLSWFNNWNFFRKEKIEIQVKINSENIATSTASTSISSQSSNSNGGFFDNVILPDQATSPTQESIQKKPVTTVSKNHNYIPISAVDFEIKRVDINLEYAQNYISYVQKVINQTQERMNFIQSINIYNDEFLNVLVKVDRLSIGYYDSVITYLNQLIAISKSNLLAYKDKREKLVDSFYQTEKETTGDTLSILNQGDKEGEIADALTKQASDFAIYFEKSESNYYSFVNTVKARDASYSPSFSNFTLPTRTYTPPVMQPLPVYKQTTCTISPVGGGGVDLIGRCY